jgi:DNA modification methylase
MFSLVGETVLDPFVGSGTTIKAALELGRNAIGYEVQPAYIPIIREKLNIDSLIAPNAQNSHAHSIA